MTADEWNKRYPPGTGMAGDVSLRHIEPVALLKVYIAGTGRNFIGRFEAGFEAAADQLWRLGHEPVNPAARGFMGLDRLDASGGGYATAAMAGVMRACITDLLACDAFTLLPGWADSRGAVLETLIARSLGMAYVALDVPEEEVRRTVLTVRFEVKPFAVGGEA